MVHNAVQVEVAYVVTLEEWSIVIGLSVCLSVCVSVCPQEYISGTAGPIFTNFLYRSPVAIARSSSGGVAIRYVLPFLWMTSRLAIMDHMAIAALRHRAESDVYECLVFDFVLVCFCRCH